MCGKLGKRNLNIFAVSNLYGQVIFVKQLVDSHILSGASI